MYINTVCCGGYLLKIIVIDDFDKGRYGTLFISVSSGSDRLDDVTVPDRVRGAVSWWWE